MLQLGDDNFMDHQATLTSQGVSLLKAKSDSITQASDDECHLWESSVTEVVPSTSSQEMKRNESPKGWQRDRSWIMLSDDGDEDEGTRRFRTTSVGKVGKNIREERKPFWRQGKLPVWKSKAQKVRSRTSNIMHRVFRKKQETNLPTFTEEESCPSLKMPHVYAPLDENLSEDDEEEYEIVFEGGYEEAEIVLADTTMEMVYYEMSEITNRSPSNSTTRHRSIRRCSKEFIAVENSWGNENLNAIQQDPIHDPINKTDAGNAGGKQVEISQPSQLNPPVLEVSNYSRTLSSDISDVSSLSDTYQMSLEFSLETGFGPRTSYLLAMSENIVRNLEQLELRETATIARCLVLIMDPLQRIFEIVPIPYTYEQTTIGDVLAMLPRMATDKRLAKLKFTGLSYEGILIDAPMVPVEILLDAQSTRKPLYAIPDKYTATDIEGIGNMLVQTPSVATLIREQMEKLERTNAIFQPRPTQFLDNKSADLAQVPRRVTGNSSLFLTKQTNGRNEVK